MHCPDLETIERFAEGLLAAEDSATIEQHLAECDSCRQQIEQIQHNLHLARRVANAVGVEPKPGDPSDTRSAANQAEGSTTSFPADWVTETRPLPEDTFPGYTLTNEISRGGQGVIYRAIQQSTKRKVAIKVMRQGTFADPRERARFEREAQILGSLKHPNIVTIHDAGSVTGHAFYVMDYISGKPLDEYVRGLKEQAGHESAQGRSARDSRSDSSRGNANAALRNVVELFAKVCEAVHAAHLRGIIHRDLKPSNIRVDHEGEPHVLDFGIAKLAGGIDDASPAMTVTGEFLGSVPWSSPEQAERQPDKIDIRSDVYSLGVIFYQLLTDRFPYQVTGNVRDVLERIIHEDPVRPSLAAIPDSPGSAQDQHRQSDAAFWIIDDDIETIVMRCLSKDRERRYQSAGELARDLRHYLAGEPIEARRDSAMYVLRKTIQRYRVGVVVGVILTLVMTASLIGVALLYRSERHQRQEAQNQRNHATALAQQRDVAAQNAMENYKRMEQERDRTAHQAELAQEELERAQAAKRDADRASAEAHQSAELLGVLLLAKGDAAAAEPAFRDALARARKEHGDAHPQVATAMHNLAGLLRIKGDGPEAERLFTEALAMRQKLLGDREPNLIAQSLHSLADVLCDRGAYGEALPLYRRALALLERGGPEDSRPRFAIQIALARALIRTGQFNKAQDRLRRTIEGMDRVGNVPQPDRLSALESLVDLYQTWDAAEPGQSHGSDAAEWQRKLADSRATTQPATARPTTASGTQAETQPQFP